MQLALRRAYDGGHFEELCCLESHCQRQPSSTRHPQAWRRDLRWLGKWRSVTNLVFAGEKRDFGARGLSVTVRNATERIAWRTNAQPAQISPRGLHAPRFRTYSSALQASLSSTGGLAAQEESRFGTLMPYTVVQRAKLSPESNTA